MTNPLQMALMALLLVALFYHTALGLQVLIDDYVHSASKPLILTTVRLGCLALAAMGCFCRRGRSLRLRDGTAAQDLLPPSWKVSRPTGMRFATWTRVVG
ncbi:hypothetical protein [Mesorhizobium sp. AR02]|uniref:hypothetical protein n=1 Tax=Mesorhizobium sp. AR02 TaxID=2865837 RepID=UPI00215EFE5E|nr:hypothetical protein [Mesorhizobium sp. AR02]